MIRINVSIFEKIKIRKIEKRRKTKKIQRMLQMTQDLDTSVALTSQNVEKLHCWTVKLFRQTLCVPL